MFESYKSPWLDQTALAAGRTLLGTVPGCTGKIPENCTDLGKGLDRFCTRTAQALYRNRLRTGTPPLSDYQRDALHFALGRRDACFWHVVGSGKTRTGLTWGLLTGRKVVYCTRASARRTIEAEVLKWTTVTPQVLTGTDPYTRDGMVPGKRKALIKGRVQVDTPLDESATVYIIGYEILPSWIEVLTDAAAGQGWSVIFDEVHHVKAYKRKKSPDGRLNRAAAAKQLSLAATRRLADTGTPIRDRPRDLWAELDLVEPAAWGSNWDFVHRYCLPETAPIWMADNLTHRPISQLRIGDRVVGWKKVDGRDTLTPAEVTHITVHRARTVLVRTAAGCELRCTSDHKWKASHKHKKYPWATVKCGRALVRVVDLPEPDRLTPMQRHAAGWLGGMYDGEASRQYIAQSSIHNRETWTMLHKALSALGIPHTMVEDKKKKNGEWNAGGAVITDGRHGLLKFNHLCKPLRLKRWLHQLVLKSKIIKGLDEVVSVEDFAEEEVFTITTTTGNFVAYGYASKNCDARETSYGGLDTAGRSNESELRTRLDRVVHRVGYAEVQQGIPPKTFTVIRIKEEDQEPVEVARKRLPATLQGKLPRSIALASAMKLPAVIEQIESYFDESSTLKVAVFTFLRQDTKQIATALQKSLGATVQVFSADGGTPVDKRNDIRLAYMAHPGPCVLVGTGDAWGEAVALNDTDKAVFASLPFTPGSLEQWIGRFHRKGQTKKVEIVFTVAVGTVDEHVANILLEKVPALDAQVSLGGESDLTLHLETAVGMNDEETKAALISKILEGGNVD